jgi:NAD(P)H-hydrate epimerase
MKSLYAVAQMREIERRADAGGLSYARMMQNAGRGAASAILERLAAQPRRADTGARVLVLAGPGNNGGDGLVCALALAEAAQGGGSLGAPAVYLLRPRAEDDPVFEPLRQRGLPVADAEGDPGFRQLREWIERADIAVDALLGTGAARAIEGDLREILRVVQANRPPLVVALDGPTGMNYDTGALDPATVPADLTLTFHAPKRGHYCFPAAAARGELAVVPIGIAPGADEPDLALLDDAGVRGLLPRRRPDANKGAHGRALVVGGCADYAGAPILAAAGAYRVGAGLVALAAPAPVRAAAATALPEAVHLPFPGDAGVMTDAALPRLVAWAGAAPENHALLIGPGLGQAPETRQFLARLLPALASARPALRAVADADALNLLAGMAGWPGLLPAGSVLTPHPGEMARLRRCAIADVQADRIEQALQGAREWGHTVVLKGAYTVVSSPDGRAAVLPFANPAMAVAGTGDVLAGAITGFLAQGLGAHEAALCGAYVHGLAGEHWRAAHGEAGLLASDLLALLPPAIRAVA